MAAYSQDVRDRVLRGLERGERPVDIARRLEVTRVWVYQVKARYEQEGERSSRRLRISALPGGGLGIADTRVDCRAARSHAGRDVRTSGRTRHCHQAAGALASTQPVGAEP